VSASFRYAGKDIRFLKYLEEKIEGNPSSSLFAMLSYFYLQVDKVAEALSIAQRGVIAHPNYSTGHVVLAMAMERAKLFNDAKKELLKARDLHPGSKIVERLMAELEKNEQADEIGRRLADQFRKNRDKDIMKTVEETIEANRHKPSTDDFLIPGLDVIVGEELFRPPKQSTEQGSPLNSSSTEKYAEVDIGDQINREAPTTEPSSFFERTAQPDRDRNFIEQIDGSDIAKSIIEKVTREVAERERSIPGEGTSSVTQSVDSIERKGSDFHPLIPEMGSLKQREHFSDELDFEALARELESVPPIKPNKDSLHANDEELSIDLTPEIVTDTLATILEQQGQIRAAIKAYNIMLKKNPNRADFYRKKIVELSQIGTTNKGMSGAQDSNA
jgi:tetratricopeptide (TPR) repeat protein